MPKLDEAIKIIEQSGSVREHPADIIILVLLREYLANSHEYPCPWCQVEKLQRILGDARGIIEDSRTHYVGEDM